MITKQTHLLSHIVCGNTLSFADPEPRAAVPNDDRADGFQHLAERVAIAGNCISNDSIETISENVIVGAFSSVTDEALPWLVCQDNSNDCCGPSDSSRPSPAAVSHCRCRIVAHLHHLVRAVLGTSISAQQAASAQVSGTNPNWWVRASAASATRRESSNRPALHNAAA